MNFLDADVPDHTDFPPQTAVPGLRALDSSFRCDICGELYDAPVTISCGHCFCSTCIRSSLAIKQECPSCRKIANEGHIRPNPVLEAVISSWMEARPFVLGLINREKERESSSNSSTQSDKGTAKKRKRSVESSSSIDALGGNPAGPSHLALFPRGADATTPRPLSRAMKQMAKRDDIIDITTVPSSDTEEQELTPLCNVAPKPEALVKCPLCQKKVRYGNVNIHMDNGCKDPAGPSDSAAASWSKLMGMPGKNGQQKGKHKKKDSDSDDDYPLPIATYATLKDKQLKDMLVEQGLPLTGDRPIWEQRHQRWVILFNANLDKSIPNRKTRAELKRDLKKWEEERGRKKKIVVKDVVNYQIEHKNEFARLVSQAKQTRVNTTTHSIADSSRCSPPPPTESKSMNLPIPCPQSTDPSNTIVIDPQA